MFERFLKLIALLILATLMAGCAKPLPPAPPQAEPQAPREVQREARVAYLTVGHGELVENKSDGAVAGRTGKWIRSYFESQRYTVRDLGLAQGLGTDIPTDAAVVGVLGPTRAMRPEEIATLERYARRGGHLLLALDPEPKIDLAPLAEIVGLSWSPTLLAHDKVMVSHLHNKSDRTILVTNRFSSHASVATLKQNLARMPIIFVGASWLGRKDDRDFEVDFAVKSLREAFDDLNGNLELDEAGGEKRDAYNLAAAVSKRVPAPAGFEGKHPPELRAFVTADADAFSDQIMVHEPNKVFVGDVIRWLGGEESFSGAVIGTEEVRMEPSKP